MTTLRLGGHYLAMVTISFQQIVTLVMINWIGLTHGPDGVSSIARPDLFQTAQGYLAFCVAVLAIVGYRVWHLPNTRLGRAMRAVRDNELAAGVTGIDVFRTKVIAFGSARCSAASAAACSPAASPISARTSSPSRSIVFLTMSLLGGVASPFGAVFGTGLLILLPEWLRFLKTSGLYLAVYGLSVILIMVFMPDGIWGFVTARLERWRSQDQGARGSGGAAAEAGDASAATSCSKSPGLAKHFGGLKAVDGVDIAVRRGGVHALIGPNGSGKTTTLNVLSGLYRPTAGKILLDGIDITDLPPHERAAAGLGRTFQNIRLFRSMTALENVVIGAERPGNT